MSLRKTKQPSIFGFSLVELVIVSSFSLILISILYKLIFGLLATQKINQALLEIQQNSLLATSILNADIQKTGYNPTFISGVNKVSKSRVQSNQYSDSYLTVQYQYDNTQYTLMGKRNCLNNHSQAVNGFTQNQYYTHLSKTTHQYQLKCRSYNTKSYRSTDLVNQVKNFIVYYGVDEFNADNNTIGQDGFVDRYVPINQVNDLSNVKSIIYALNLTSNHKTQMTNLNLWQNTYDSNVLSIWLSQSNKLY